MKKIIKGFLYNTETATLIATGGNNLSRDNLKWTKEELYLTKNGSWFLLGRGGPCSRWAEPVTSKVQKAGTDIAPIEASYARSWMDSNKINVDIICAHFDIKEA